MMDSLRGFSAFAAWRLFRYLGALTAEIKSAYLGAPSGTGHLNQPNTVRRVCVRSARSDSSCAPTSPPRCCAVLLSHFPQSGGTFPRLLQQFLGLALSTRRQVSKAS